MDAWDNFKEVLAKTNITQVKPVRQEIKSDLDFAVLRFKQEKEKQEKMARTVICY